MAKRKVEFVENEYYHIYNRGNSKQKIFLDEEDYKRFTQYLYVCNSYKSLNFRDDIIKQKIDALDFDRGEALISIGAWVLMPNHFHIYITPTSQKRGLGQRKTLPEFIQKLSTSYSKYFNAKYKRTGSLFEGPFKSVYIDNDTQAKYLFSYIHLNPIKLIEPKWKEIGIRNKKKAFEFLQKYKWSSYLDYKNIQRLENKILNVEGFPKYFKNIKDFDQDILDWLREE